ncbi:MAG: hypothetical protein QOH35_4886 [Acidobacteriaceae bacterium]|nr:hypothetical protein [Acidobacteriaceae bacterium]
MHFHLAGINNQNFLMRDEETGSFWQQITGAAIAGPLKGAKLSLVAQDELTFGLWKKEQPNGTVLAPLKRDAAKYEKATWESEIAKLPTVIHATKGTLPDRETILGVAMNGAARAFPLGKLTIASPVLIDDVGGEPIMLVLGPDGKSVRAFSRKIVTNTLEFYGRGGGNTGDPWVLLDSDSLSDWSFEGCAFSGPMKGQCLPRIDALKDFWFDWQHYHPDSSIYRH